MSIEYYHIVHEQENPPTLFPQGSHLPRTDVSATPGLGMPTTLSVSALRRLPTYLGTEVREFYGLRRRLRVWVRMVKEEDSGGTAVFLAATQQILFASRTILFQVAKGGLQRHAARGRGAPRPRRLESIGKALSSSGGPVTRTCIGPSDFSHSFLSPR